MLEFTADQLDSFLREDTGERVGMLNLLRFKPDGGQERYGEYLAAVTPVGERYGATPLYMGVGQSPLVAEPGQEWDAVLVVSYPSRAAFAGMIRDPEYQAVAHLRSEALLEATLQPTDPMLG